MVNVKGYISSNFTKSFLTIFLPFFIIISLVFLVRIAALTSKIQIDFSELLLLYSYSIPEIVFYTLPLSFIAALANLLISLSQGNELIALYALGLRSQKILKGLLWISILFSFLLLAISLLAMPLSKQFYRAFKEEKRNDARLNIVPGELGQKFGNYYIYIKDKTEDAFQNIVIYNRTDKANEQFFSSQSGNMNRNQNVASLLLNEGYGYTYSKVKLQQAEYKTLEIFDTSQKKGFKFKSVLSYWQEAAKDDAKTALFYFYQSDSSAFSLSCCIIYNDQPTIPGQPFIPGYFHQYTVLLYHCIYTAKVGNHPYAYLLGYHYHDLRAMAL